MSLIHISNLTFAYEGSYDNIFENVSFQIDSDWKLGFIGRNGRGKTTFLKLLRGEHEYRGSISGKVDFEYFPFAVERMEQLTQTVMEGICPECQEWQVLREFSLLQVPEEVLYRPFVTLSQGEQTKVLLASLFLKNNRFLLIDEPTNHLDREARELVSRYLNTKQGFILVSHDRTFLDSCIDHVLSINKTNIEVQKGNFSSWWEDKRRQDQFELDENERLKKDISRLTAAARRTAGWSDQVEKTKLGNNNSGVKPDRGYIGHKSAKMMKRAKNIEARQQAAIEEKSGLLKNVENAGRLQISQIDFYTRQMIDVTKLNISYGGKAACENVSFTVEQGDRIALCGKNGSGKSSLLKLICGEPLAYTGSFRKASRLVISYVSQDTSWLTGSLRDYIREYDIDESIFKATLRKLDFSRIQFEKDMADFSGGQKKKVLLARSLCEKAHLYVWDEPLNFIDVISRLQLEELLLTFAPTILFVEHDSVFCHHIATKVVELKA